MTGPEHYLEAERLLKSGADNFLRYGSAGSALDAAQVHATLALAAATALSAPVEDDLAGFTVEDRDAWFKAAGEKPGTDYDVKDSFA
ncbi:hypothetical protein [Streptomyces griseorubiginosus]|uniref:hypothetical protein n=1 Tax=Streptomyces griseorubiginosus TaxID=67304 RepID=UPI00332F0126